MRAISMSVLLWGFISNLAFAAYVVPNPPGVSKFIAVTLEKEIAPSTYKLAAEIVPLRFPALDELERELRSHVYSDNKEVDAARKKTMELPQGRCYFKAGYHEYMQKQTSGMYGKATITHMIASAWAEKYSQQQLQRIQAFYAHPVVQKVFKLNIQEGLEMTNMVNGFLAYIKLYNDNKISKADLEALDALSKQPNIEEIYEFDEDSARDMSTYPDWLKKAGLTSIITRNFYQDHKQEIDDCMKEPA